MVNEVNPSGEQKIAEAEVDRFRGNLGPFVVAAETTRMAMVFTAAAPGNPIIFVNNSFLSLTGYMREEVLGNSFNSLMARGADPEVLALVEAALEDSSDREVTIVEHPVADTAEPIVAEPDVAESAPMLNEPQAVAEPVAAEPFTGREDAWHTPVPEQQTSPVDELPPVSRPTYVLDRVDRLLPPDIWKELGWTERD